MQFLPRSRRRTWLLAGAVWLAACAGWWWLLPPVPRAALELDSDSRLLGFGPTGETALVHRWGSSSVDLLELATGRTTTLHRCPGSIQVAAKTGDHRFWLLEMSSHETRRFVRLDLIAGTALPLLNEVPIGMPRSDAIAVSPDGRNCLMNPHQNTGFFLWDLEANHIRPIQPTIKFSAAFSGDGRWLAGFDAESHDVRVFDCETLACHTTLPTPHDAHGFRIVFSQDGTRLVAEFVDEPAPVVLCWNVARQTEVLRTRMMRPQFVRDGKSLAGVVNEGQAAFVDCIDLSSGFRRQHLRTDQFPHIGEVSPDGRVMVTQREQEHTLTAVELWAQKLGLSFLAQTRALLAVGSATRLQFVDLDNGDVLASDWSERPFRFCSFDRDPPLPFEWLPGQRAVAVRDTENGDQWRIWNLPSRPSARLFAIGAVVFAMPIALLARLRVRKLRAA